jgi:hypothetical protein
MSYLDQEDQSLMHLFTLRNDISNTNHPNR